MISYRRSLDDSSIQSVERSCVDQFSQTSFNLEVEMVYERSKWSEKARLQVIQAVIKVETELLDESPGKCWRTLGRGSPGIASKWDRVVKLLPHYMRGRTWNKFTGKYNQYKCSRLFYSLRQAYKKIEETNVKSFLSLTEQEYRLFQQREAALKSRLPLVPQNSLQDSHSNSQSLDSYAEDSSGRHYLSFEEEDQDIYSSAERSCDSGSLERSEDLVQLEGTLGTEVRSRDDCEMSDGETSESEFMVRYLKNGERTDSSSRKSMKKIEWRPAPGHPSSESNDLVSPVKPTPMIKAVSSEDLDTILERPLRCLDAEFSQLSAWVKSDAIPVGRELVNELTLSALRRSGKRRKLDAQRPAPGMRTGPFDGLIQRSSVGMTDSRIRALFHKLRIRFSEELKKTCESIAEEVIDGI